jgi:transposase InsO family protein
MKKHLDQRGVVCGRHRVARLMRDHSIRARRKRPFRPKTTQPGKAPCPNLLVDIPALTAPNQSWVSDITYVPTKEGFL